VRPWTKSIVPDAAKCEASHKVSCDNLPWAAGGDLTHVAIATTAREGTAAVAVDPDLVGTLTLNLKVV